MQSLLQLSVCSRPVCSLLTVSAGLKLVSSCVNEVSSQDLLQHAPVTLEMRFFAQSWTFAKTMAR